MQYMRLPAELITGLVTIGFAEHELAGITMTGCPGVTVGRRTSSSGNAVISGPLVAG